MSEESLLFQEFSMKLDATIETHVQQSATFRKVFLERDADEYKFVVSTYLMVANLLREVVPGIDTCTVRCP